ncbi:hypothetical protein J6590_079786 [Homalodisca vitripennis]|nr:hypothetical protein J6590_079786 [Homalodisca vitripennis]
MKAARRGAVLGHVCRETPRNLAHVSRTHTVHMTSRQAGCLCHRACLYRYSAFLLFFSFVYLQAVPSKIIKNPLFSTDDSTPRHNLQDEKTPSLDFETGTVLEYLRRVQPPPPLLRVSTPLLVRPLWKCQARESSAKQGGNCNGSPSPSIRPAHLFWCTVPHRSAERRVIADPEDIAVVSPVRIVSSKNCGKDDHSIGFLKRWQCSGDKSPYLIFLPDNQLALHLYPRAR